MEFFSIIVGLGFTLLLLIVGFAIGTINERRHLNRIQRREEANRDIIQTQSRMFLSSIPGDRPPQILCAETVIASDYFKNFLASFRKIFGGEMRSYHSLMVRARREALMRLVEQARQLGFNAICNVRLEPADIGGNFQKKRAAMVCIIATATGYHTDLVKPRPLGDEDKAPKPAV